MAHHYTVLLHAGTPADVIALFTDFKPYAHGEFTALDCIELDTSGNYCQMTFPTEEPDQPMRTWLPHRHVAFAIEYLGPRPASFARPGESPP